MSTQEVISHRSLPSAEAFLGELGPLQRRRDAADWIYRGHGDAKWMLAAKAHRLDQKPYAPFGIPCEIGPDDQAWSVYSDAEEELLERFSRGLDRSGLPIPVRALRLGLRASEQWSSADTHPDAIPLLALAQHFGLPTKLLDWTRLARVASYFAAADAAKAPAEDKRLAVWALNTTFVRSLENRSVDSTELTIQTAPASSNPNLHAQQGLFTRTEGENAHLYAVDAFVSRAVDAAKSWEFKPWQNEPGNNPNLTPLPIMVCWTLAQTEASKLLRLLAYEGVTGATMFPGYDGVVRAMREESLWDKP